MTIERNEELKKGQYLAIWMIAACMGIAYLLLCFNHNVWADEAYTLAMGQSKIIDTLETYHSSSFVKRAIRTNLHFQPTFSEREPPTLVLRPRYSIPTI